MGWVMLDFGKEMLGFWMGQVGVGRWQCEVIDQHIVDVLEFLMGACRSHRRGERVSRHVDESTTTDGVGDA